MDYYEKLQKDFEIGFNELKKSWEDAEVDQKFSQKFFEKDYVNVQWEDYKKSILDIADAVDKKKVS